MVVWMVYVDLPQAANVEKQLDPTGHVRSAPELVKRSISLLFNVCRKYAASLFFN